jgi:UDP-glucose 4-epimerase
LEFARRCGAAFIFASSGAVAGYKPESPYGASKAAGELFCQAYTAAFGVRTTVLRLSSVYGPFSEHKESVLAAFCKQALRGDALQIRGDGFQTRDFVFVNDVVEAFRHAGCNDPGLGPFGVASGQATSVQTLATFVAEKSGVEIQYAAPAVGELVNAPNQTLLLPGWKAKTDLASGLAVTWQYFEEALHG